MTSAEAIQELRERGLETTYWRLRGLIERGELPKPRLSSSLNFDWTPADVRRAARVLRRKVMAPA